MRVVEYYSHLNGYEHIVVHKPGLWTVITDVVKAGELYNLLRQGRNTPAVPLVLVGIAP